jgi:hypothetical protein
LIERFPGSISFADTFVIMQEERNHADYDPLARYVRAEILDDLFNIGSMR